MKKRKKDFIMAVVLGALSLASCGTAKKDDIASDFNNIGNATKTDAEYPDVPNRLEYVVQSVSSGAVITVSADVETNGLENAYVYEVNRKEFNEETLKQIADNFFESDYTYIKPYEHCSLEELELEKTFYQQLTDEYGDDVYLYANHYREKADELIAGYNENAPSYMEHHGLIYHNNQWHEEDSFWGQAEGHGMFQVTEADYSRLRGERDGHIYELYYEKYYTESKTSSSSVVNDLHNPERMIIMCIDTPYYLKGCTDMDASLQSNMYDYNTALSQAENVVKKIGFKEWEVIDTRQLDVATSSERTYLGLNGYEFWFLPVMNGKYVFNCRGKHMLAFGSDHDAEWVYGTGQPLVRVLVTDNGIEEIDIWGTYDNAKNEGEKVELMPFQKIDEIAKEYMGNYRASDNIEITSVKLGYLYISYDGVKYSLVPVWAYCNGNGSKETVFVYINALDGQLVSEGKEKIFLGYHPVVGRFITQLQW